MLFIYNKKVGCDGCGKTTDLVAHKSYGHHIPYTWLVCIDHTKRHNQSANYTTVPAAGGHMKKAKEASCIYNANRHAVKLAKPWCVWIDNILPEVRPPHVKIHAGMCEPEMCRLCKAYVPES